MLDMQEIYNTIQELEQGETNFNSCAKLASLYIIREYYKTPEITKETHIESPIKNNLDLDVKKELDDILPHYEIYCNLKKEYQMGKISKEPIIQAFNSVCKEIHEFIHTLYSSTDMQEEKDLLHDMIQNLHM